MIDSFYRTGGKVNSVYWLLVADLLAESRTQKLLDREPGSSLCHHLWGPASCCQKDCGYPKARKKKVKWSLCLQVWKFKIKPYPSQTSSSTHAYPVHVVMKLLITEIPSEKSCKVSTSITNMLVHHSDHANMMQWLWYLFFSCLFCFLPRRKPPISVYTHQRKYIQSEGNDYQIFYFIHSLSQIHD